MIIYLTIVVVVLILATLALALKGNKPFAWVQFYAKGKDAGFSTQEIALLRKVAEETGLEEPQALFWSVKQLDNCIKKISARVKGASREKAEEINEFLAKLYEYRKKIEMEQPRFKSGIKSSRHIHAGQRIKILLQGSGVYSSQVLENAHKHLVCSYPAGARYGEGYAWRNRKVSIYFWRQDDAGYVFDSVVLDEVLVKNSPTLYIAHSDSLFRAQKRKSIRAKSKLPAYLYLVKRIEGAYEKVEKNPGLRCLVQDLSEDGAAILIGGKALPSLKLKIQFYIGDNVVVMSGVAKGVEYSKDENKSLIHMQAQAPSPRIRNLILAYVFNLHETIATGEAGAEAEADTEAELEPISDIEEAEEGLEPEEGAENEGTQ